ncbi:MAG: hypothetical protein ABIH22_04760, partial [Candidatus Margulisiibacteriota bacterium]
MRAERAGMLPESQVSQVSPEELINETQITSTKPEFESHGKIPRFTRKKIGKIAAATLAAATVTLVPAVALAAG